MGTKQNPGQYDCYDKAMPDEPMFILLARDPQAPRLIEEWARWRATLVAEGVRPNDGPMVDEARACAEAMRDWRLANNGLWRSEK